MEARGIEVLEGNYWCFRVLKKMSEEGGGGERLVICIEFRFCRVLSFLRSLLFFLNLAGNFGRVGIGGRR